MQGILLFFHILVCFFLIIVVLLQSGKSADLAGAFGGYGSQSTFGPRGAASLLSKITTTLAVLFMVTSLLLQVLAAHKNRSGSVLDQEKPVAKTQSSQPLKPGTDTPTVPVPENPGK
ncbi:MAG: preprotein translocase subunit SecG [Candidatus Aminicenantes bacterium]|nr:preprotein translocase subunit SecG [Candidatus Aminicenantes bacterium]